MFIVDNFKIILLVGLICSGGGGGYIAPSDALKCTKNSFLTEFEECKEGESCFVSQGKSGRFGFPGLNEIISAADPLIYGCTADCPPKALQGDKQNCTKGKCCCKDGDVCNQTNDSPPEVCYHIPFLTDAPKCKPKVAKYKEELKKAGAAGLFEHYYGGFPLATLVAAWIYYFPLKPFF